LPQALEGIARAIRDQDCSLERACKFITLLQAAHPIAPTRIILPTQLDKWVLRSAARQIQVSCSAARTQLPPPSGNEPHFVTLPAPSSEAAFDLKANNLPTTDPVLLSRLATQGDPDLRYWMIHWQHEFSLGQLVNEHNREELVQILGRSKLPLTMLLQMADGYHAITHDSNSSEAWLIGCASQTDADFAVALDQWWRGLASGQTADEAQRQKVQIESGRGNLSSELLYQVGDLSSVVAHDPQTTAMLFAAAVSHGHSELDHLPMGSTKALPTLQAMKRCEPMLWNAVNTGNPEYVRSIDILNSDIEKWIRPDDPTLGWAVAWAKIGRAECQYLWGKNDEAIAQCEQIDSSGLSQDQREGLAWISGLAFFSKGCFADAAIQFRAVANDSNYKYAENASRFLIVSLARSARADEANARFDDWVRRYHPNVDQAAAVLGRMGITTQ
jgi:hypothetical protein